MGPEASCFFYQRITARTKASKDQEHIDIVLLSHATMPDRTHAILTGEKQEFLQAIEKDVRALETLGVANIAIPCNTSHYFLKDIQALTDIPVINMVEESIKYVTYLHPGIQKVGIMGTDGTLQAGTYYRAGRKYGVQAVAPHEEAQRDVMSLIYDDVKSGKRGDRSKFDRAYADLKAQGCEAVILACTEISVFKEHYPVPADCVDAMDVLVMESIFRSEAQIKDA